MVGNVFNVSYSKLSLLSIQMATLTNVYIANNIFYRNKFWCIVGAGLLLYKLENNTFYNQEAPAIVDCHKCIYMEVNTIRVMETTAPISAPFSLKPLTGIPFTLILNDVQLLNNSFSNYDFGLVFMLPQIHTLVLNGLLVQGNCKFCSIP